VDLSGLSTADAACALRRAALDVAVSLDGWTEGSRNDIWALRPAPRQVQVFGAVRSRRVC
jgi:predicted O-linked N-acetylglucosamine transferase (SPINDLY family)